MPASGSRRMLVGASLAVLAAPTLSSTIHAQGPREIVARAAAAMGGEQALRALESTSVEFNSATFGLGQEETPASPARATFFTGRVINDFAGRRRLLSQEARPITGNPVRARLVMAGGVALNETVGGAQVPSGPAAVAAMERAMRLHPERLILAALDAPNSLRALAPRPLRGELADGVRYAAGEDTLSIYFDRLSGLPLATETVTDDPILGDRRTLTLFTRWQNADGVKLARQTDVEVNGRLLSHTVITSATTNDTLADSLFAIPDSIAARAQRGPAPAAPIVVTLAELAPGVWRAEGGSHHSLVIEQPTRLVVVEAPQSSARVRAVLDTLRSRFPRKAVGFVVNSHHHWDHSGGVREAIAAGAPIVTHRRNVNFVRQLGQVRKTVAPDGLTRRPRAANIQRVADSLTIGSGDSRVVLYELPTSHVEGMLAAYVPAARLLYVVDVLSPGPNPLPRTGSAEVAAMVRARGLAVDRLVGGHGGIAPWADVERAAGGQ